MREHKAIMADLISANRAWNNLDQTCDRLMAQFAGHRDVPGFAQHLSGACSALRARMEELWNMAEDCERELDALAASADVKVAP